MTDDPRALYREQILDHSKNPRHMGPLPDATHETTAINPLCGDRVTLRLRLNGDRIEVARFEARGCAIALASASIMADAIDRGDVAEAQTRAARLFALVRDGAEPIADDGDLTALASVRSVPARKRCATLAWEALSELLG